MQTLTKWMAFICILFLSSTISTLAAIDLELSMTADKTNVEIYKNVTYTLTVTNKGEESATGIGIEFPLPINTAYTGSSTSKGNYVHWTNTWTINELAVGESASMDLIAFTLSANELRKAFAEVVEANQSDSDSTPDNNNLGYPTEDDEAQKTVLAVGQGERDLRLEIRADQEETSIGDEVRLLMIFYSDDTETAGPAIAKAHLPEGFSLNYANGYGFYDRYSGEWVVPTDITGGNIFFMELVGQTTNIDAPLVAFAEIIAATNPDSDSTPNNDNGEFTPDEDDEDLVTIEPYTGVLESDLEMTVNVNVFPPDNPADPTTFGAFFVLRNRGPANNKDIWVDIEIPEGVEVIEFTTTPNYLPYTLGEDWQVDFIPNDGQFILRIGGRITDPTIPLTFYAEVREAAYPDPDSTPDNNATQIPNEDDEGSFTIPPSNGSKPDLEAYVLDVTPFAVQQGETLEVEFTVENVNGVAAPASKVHIWLDDELSYSPYHSEVELSLGMEDIPALEVGESLTLNKTYTIPSGFASGEYRMYIKADGDDSIDEDIEENVSVYSRVITIGGTTPNLFVRNMNVSGVLAAGGMVTISCEIGNGGVATAPMNTLKYYFSKDSNPNSGDIFIGSEIVPELNVGDFSQHSIVFEIPDTLSFDIPYFDNLYYFICFADADNEIEEEYEMDNIATSFNFIEEAKPNIRINNVRYTGQGNNSPLYLSGELTNLGTAFAPNAIYTVYLSKDQTVSSDDKTVASTQMPGVAAGQTIKLSTIAEGLNDPVGEYYLIWVMDSNNTIEETNENDNQLSVRITKDEENEDEDYFLQHFGTDFPLQLEENSIDYELVSQFFGSKITYTHANISKTGNLEDVPLPLQVDAEFDGKSFKRIDDGFVELGSKNKTTLYIAKRNESGNISWIQEYQLAEQLELWAADIEATVDGGFIATGSAFTKDEIEYLGDVIERHTAHVFALKVNANGSQEWFNFYQTPFTGIEGVNYHYENGIQVTQLQDGSFAIAASRGVYTVSGLPIHPSNGSTVSTHEIDDNGNSTNVEGEIGQAGAYASITELIPTADGGYLYTHLLNYVGNGGQVAFATKKGGSQSWEYDRYSSKFGTSYFNDVVQTSDGGFMLMGDYVDFAAPDNPPANFFKLDENGVEQWTNYIGKIASVLIQTSDGGFLIAGSKDGEVFAAKLDEDTNLTPPIETEGVDIELQYTVDKPNYQQWEKIKYTLTATNSGTEKATNLVISDPIPFGMAFTSRIVSTGTYNLWFQTWTIPELAAGETATLELTIFTLLNDSKIVKFAQVKSLDQTDIDSTPNNNNTKIPQEDDEAAISISPIGGSGGGKNALENPIAESGALKLYNLFPVPADDELNIIFGTGGFQANVLLYDANGKLLERQSLRVNQGENMLQLKVSQLVAGFYTISIETPEGFVRGKFLKQ